jgi:hypothetical protein
MFGDAFAADLLELLRYREFGTAVLLVVPGLFAIALVYALLKGDVRAICAANVVIALALIVVFLAALDVSADATIAGDAPLALFALIEIAVIVAALAGFQRLSWVVFFVHGAILIPLALLVGLFAGNPIF